MKKDITEQALRIVRAKKKKNQDLFNEKISVLEKDKEFVKIEKEYICIHAREENTKLINFYNFTI